MEENIEKLICDRKAFNDFVYTPLQEAIEELRKRKGNTVLNKTIINLLPAGLPSFIDPNNNYVFLSRDLATPNYEMRRFLSIVDALDNFSPVFWEYYGDKYTPNINETKYYLGNLNFYTGDEKEEEKNLNKIKILDFNVSSGKKFSEVHTLWGQPLVDFHHEFIDQTYFANRSKNFKHVPIYFDATTWYKNSGEKVKIYYEYIFYLFITHGILFENFLINDKQEVGFIRDVFLPAFIKIKEKFGYKPLIVALEHTEVEGKHFWMYYPKNAMAYVKSKLGL